MSGAQRERIAADVHSIFGKKSVEPGMQKAIPLQYKVPTALTSSENEFPGLK